MIFKSLTKHSNARILIEKERIDLSKAKRKHKDSLRCYPSYM